MSEDLTPEALARQVPGREVRAYPALMSTNADARAWARAGGPAGGVVVADYQAAAQGRGGLPWEVRRGRDLAFTLLLRPRLEPDDEGWLFIAGAVALLDVLGGDASVEWPDRIEHEGRHVADVAGFAGLGAGGGVEWALVDVLLRDAPAPRGALLARVAEAVEAVQEPEAAALARFGERCTTLGRAVEAHIIPTWPDGVRIPGTASAVLADGSLVLAQDDGRRIAVRPQHLARLVPAQSSAAG